MHVSLDGYVAGENGEMDWILLEEEIFDHAGDRTREADTALYGRITYQLMESYWPTAADQPHPTKHDIQHSQWYQQVEKVVVSKSMKGLDLPHTTIISENLAANIRQLKKVPGKEIVIFGSPTVTHTLMEENLIDDYWLFVNPILLGKGIGLNHNLKNSIHLKLVTSETFASGVVGLHYEANTNK